MIISEYINKRLKTHFLFEILCAFIRCKSLPFLLFFCFSAPAFANLKIAYVDVPPYAFQAPNKKAKGLLIDSFRGIVQTLDLEAEFVYLPHRRLLDFIKKGNVDLWAGLDKSQISDDLALVSKTPLFVMELQVYWKADTTSVDKLEDLVDKNLILISSYSYGGNYNKLSEGSRSVRYTINHEDGFEQLLSGNKEYLLVYKQISEQIIDKFQITGVQKTTLAKYDLYVKLSRTYPNAIEVMQEIDEYLLTLKKNPKIN
jgi:hypothetical protein